MPSMAVRFRTALAKKIKFQVQEKRSFNWLCKPGYKNIQKKHSKKSGISEMQSRTFFECDKLYSKLPLRVKSGPWIESRVKEFK
jgi:hypothetical protein